MATDEFSGYYEELLDGTYDCVDRIILNAHFGLAGSPGGFRTWWRALCGGDADLDNTHLMRFSGRFARRVHAYAQAHGIPLVHCPAGERKHEAAEALLPADPAFEGVFAIQVSRAPAPLRDITRFGHGGLNVGRKRPMPYANWYAFQIVDREWGHLTIRLCPHPPFPAMVILNGHEYVAAAARREGLAFTKEGNCFTEVPDAAGLARVADTMRAPGSVGRLSQVCERWIYSACLCFALTVEEQQRSGFRYSYSVYQAEYSRNLLFTRGRVMEDVFNGVIDRTRSLLDLDTVKMIFGHKRRPSARGAAASRSRSQAAVETPVYTLTVFRIHFRRLTVKVYSKGGRVLRIEAIAHNTEDLRCGKRLDRFPEIVSALEGLVDRFLAVLRCVNTSWIDDGTLDALPLPATVGATRVGGVDINRPRTRAVVAGVVAASADPRGFTVGQLAVKVREALRCEAPAYRPRQASYDLKKLRAKGLVVRMEGTRRYQATPDGLRRLVALHVLREKVLKPLLSGVGRESSERKPPNQGAIDAHYENIQIHMQALFQALGIAA
jgi:hypothetical protein